MSLAIQPARPTPPLPRSAARPAAGRGPAQLHLVRPGGAAGVSLDRSRGRLTRRVRLAATLTTLAACVCCGVGVASAQVRPAPTVVVVGDGQTLSEVAHRAYPRMPVSNAVARVQLANDLNSTDVEAGQRLRLPR